MAATATIENTALWQRECAACGADISNRNAGAKACGATCRKRLTRGWTKTPAAKVETAAVAPDERHRAWAELERLDRTLTFWCDPLRFPRLPDAKRRRLRDEIADVHRTLGMDA
jgi:hypothetical protein